MLKAETLFGCLCLFLICFASKTAFFSTRGAPCAKLRTKSSIPSPERIPLIQ